MSSTDARMASASSVRARQYTVSRITKGGSAGLRIMTALPSSAPPTSQMAREVVSVNSSIFARVPGPADLEEIEATISA